MLLGTPGRVCKEKGSKKPATDFEQAIFIICATNIFVCLSGCLIYLSGTGFTSFEHPYDFLRIGGYTAGGNNVAEQLIVSKEPK